MKAYLCTACPSIFMLFLHVLAFWVTAVKIFMQVPCIFVHLCILLRTYVYAHRTALCTLVSQAMACKTMCTCSSISIYLYYFVTNRILPGEQTCLGLGVEWRCTEGTDNQQRATVYESTYPTFHTSDSWKWQLLQNLLLEWEGLRWLLNSHARNRRRQLAVSPYRISVPLAHNLGSWDINEPNLPE